MFVDLEEQKLRTAMEDQLIFSQEKKKCAKRWFVNITESVVKSSFVRALFSLFWKGSGCRCRWTVNSFARVESVLAQCVRSRPRSL